MKVRDLDFSYFLKGFHSACFGLILHDVPMFSNSMPLLGTTYPRPGGKNTLPRTESFKRIPVSVGAGRRLA